MIKTMYIINRKTTPQIRMRKALVIQINQQSKNVGLLTKV